MEEKSGLYIKPVEMGIVDNSLVMKIKTDRQKLKPEDFRCYVYADDYFLMCTGAGDNLPSFRRGTISLNMKSRFLWLPGTYKFIFALSSVYMGVMEFRLDNEQQIEFLGMRPIEIFSPEDIASSFFGGDMEWELLTTMPGTRQLRHEAIEEARRRHWSVMISMNVEDYAKQPSGYIFTCCGNDSPAPPIRCFHRQLNAKGNIEVVDCNTLYDSALQNPLDGFNHLFNETERGTTICLDKVGALMGAGGRVIVTQLSQAALDRKYTLWLSGTRQELDALFNVYPSLWRLFPETKRLTILAPTPQEMVQNFFRQLNAWDLKPTEQVFHQLAHTIRKGYEDRTLANWSTRDINRFLRVYLDWYSDTKDLGYISLLTCNHDTVRPRFNLDYAELKLAYAFLFTMPGVPFLYYGDEIGMRYQQLPTKEGGYTRTGSRTPMQWDGTKNLGFSDGDPADLYLPVDPAADAPTVAAQEVDPDSLLSTVRALLALRHAESDLQADAPFEVVCAEAGQPFAYRRGHLLLAVNPSGAPQRIDADVAGRAVRFALGDAKPDGDGFILGAQSFVVLK